MTMQVKGKPILPVNDLNSINIHWMTEVLSQYYDSHCILTSFTLDKACSKEGYLSEIGYISAALTINNGNKKIELVVKCLPTVIDVREFIINGKLAEREVDFYKFCETNEFKIVTAKSGLSLCVPEVIYSEYKDLCLTIVMRNLKNLHYKIVLLKDGSTLQHTLTAFSSVAVVHAAGQYHFQKYGNYGVKKYEDTSFLDQYLGPNLERLSEIFKRDSLSAIFKRMLPYSKIMRNYHFKYPLFETVIHGDFWAGQCMFSEDEKQVCILDWQFATVGNPVVDLMGMFFMSSDPNILENHLTEILEHYWNELTGNLKKSNVPFSTSYDDFLKCVHHHWMSGFLFIACSLHDFLGADNISERRLRGLMNFLYKKKVFHNFIAECQFSDER